MPSGRKGERRNLTNRIGEKHFKLTVIADAGSAVGSKGEILGTNWLCQCDCGNQHLVLNKLLGKVKSCGCWKKEVNKSVQGPALAAAAKRKSFSISATDYVAKRKMALYSRHKKGRSSREWIEFHLTFDEAKPLFFAPCHYCGAHITWSGNRKILTGLHGLDRINPSKHYEPGNVVSCCKRCNYAKNDMSTQEFKDWVSQVFRNLNNF
ncbi:MAG: hypothetical protein ACK5V6_10405 [Pseudanabaena sp.]|jgi:hypothetical protein